MAEYKLYCLDGVGRIRQRHDLVAADDQSAIAVARAMEPHSHCELWSGTRKVALLTPDGAAALIDPAA